MRYSKRAGREVPVYRIVWGDVVSLEMWKAAFERKNQFRVVQLKLDSSSNQLGVCYPVK